MNDIMKGTDRDDLILQFSRIGLTYKKCGVKNLISDLVYTKRIKNDFIDYVNKKLQELWNHQNYKFINNSDSRRTLVKGWVTSSFKR